MNERVTFTPNGNDMNGHLARPKGRGPGVIVLQEWWALVPHIERIADRLAGERFVALAPDLPRLQAPVLGLFARKDGFVTPQRVKELDEELTRLGKRHEFHTYVNADHAFLNDHRPEVSDPAAAAGPGR